MGSLVCPQHCCCSCRFVGLSLHHWNLRFPALTHSLCWSEAELSTCHLNFDSLQTFLRNLVRMDFPPFFPLLNHISRLLYLAVQVSACAIFRSACCSPKVFPALVDRWPEHFSRSRMGPNKASPGNPWEKGALKDRLPYTRLLISPSLLIPLTDLLLL